MNLMGFMSSGNSEEGPSVDMLGVSPKAHPGEAHLLLCQIHPFDSLSLRVLNLCPPPPSAEPTSSMFKKKPTGAKKTVRYHGYLR